MDASTPATVALAVLIMSSLVPSNPDGDRDADILSIESDEDEATGAMKPSPTANALSASTSSKALERIEKMMYREGAGYNSLHRETEDKGVGLYREKS